MNSNTSDHRDNEYVDMFEQDRCLARLPLSLRNFVLFEAGDNFNVKQMVEVVDETGFFGPSWRDIEKQVRKFSRADHSNCYGGVYPGVQRKATPRDGPSAGTPNQQPPVDTLRMLRRLTGLRSRRDLRRIAVFFPNLTGS